MRPTTHSILSSLLLLATLAPTLPAQDTEKAEMFYKHGLVEDAKRTAIQTLFANTEAATQLRIKTLLARIAADEQRIDHAVELWQDIAKNHKGTAEAKTAALLVEQWSTLTLVGTPRAPENQLAATYFAAAQFWMGGTPQQPRLDTSWLHTEEAAEFWLRKVVTGFPGTPAAADALAAIARAWLGNEGDAGTPARGAWATVAKTQGRGAEFEIKMAKAEQAVTELKAAFPKSPHLLPLQFLIAQVYWVRSDRERAQPWLLKCAETEGPDTFWSHLARLRLQNWKS